MCWWDNFDVDEDDVVVIGAMDIFSGISSPSNISVCSQNQGNGGNGRNIEISIHQKLLLQSCSSRNKKKQALSSFAQSSRYKPFVTNVCRSAGF